MGLQHLWSLLLAVACILSLASSKNVKSTNETPLSVGVTSYCCPFDSNACGFSSDGGPLTWYWSGDGLYPNPVLFPDFFGTTNYLWTQETDQAVTISPLLVDVVEGTSFGFSYYAHIEDPSSRLSVYFSNSLGYADVIVDTLFSTGETWIYRTITCGSSPCCPSYPCSGTIKVVATVDYPPTLYAIDNVETNYGCSAPPPPTTTPAPVPGYGCCDFSYATGACGFSYYYPPAPHYWEWSVTGYTPDYILFPFFPGAPAYIFSQNDDGSATYSHEVTVVVGTQLSFTYYAHVEDLTGSSALYVYFENSAGVDALIDVLGSTDEAWVVRTLTCSTERPCCEYYPCMGRVKIVAGAVSENELYAIQHVEINGQCSITTTTTTTATTPTTTTTRTTPTTAPYVPGCCRFTTNSCGFNTVYPYTPGFWQYSGNGVRPDPTEFPYFPGAPAYIFTQDNDDATTVSQVFTVDAPTTAIGINYYAHIQDTTGPNSLLIYFANSNGADVVLLAVLGDTNELWNYYSGSCSSLRCCATYPCSGSIKFEARAIAGTGSTLYAVQEVETNNACT